MFPDDRRYLESHEWGKVDGDLVVMGITDFAVTHLSDLVFVDLPDVGSDVTKGERFGEIESVKAVSDLMSLVSGEVVEVNEELVDNLDLLKEDAYTAGWMIKVRTDNKADLDGALDNASYQKIVDAEQD